MKFLTIFALVFAAAGAADLTMEELKVRNILVPAGHAEGRITKGQMAAEGQFPYQVGLSLYDKDGKSTWCGGSLLSNTKVMTAAHCTEDKEKGIVLLGSNNRYSFEVMQNITSEDILIHPGWQNKTQLVNDISIVTIPHTEYSNNIQPVKLPGFRKVYSSFNEEEVLVSGWGYPSDRSKKVVLNLKFANKTVVPNTVCKSYYNTPVLPTNLCIATSDGTSTCSGDSGGPMVLASTGEQIGIVSFVLDRGCELGAPAVFTRVTEYLDWIKGNADINTSD